MLFEESDNCLGYLIPASGVPGLISMNVAFNISQCLNNLMSVEVKKGFSTGEMMILQPMKKNKRTYRLQDSEQPMKKNKMTYRESPYRLQHSEQSMKMIRLREDQEGIKLVLNLMCDPVAVILSNTNIE